MTVAAAGVIQTIHTLAYMALGRVENGITILRFACGQKSGIQKETTRFQSPHSGDCFKSLQTDPVFTLESTA